MSTEIDRLTGGLERLHLGVDVLELGVAVGMVGAFARLGIGLQAEAQALQQAADQFLAGGESPLRQRRGQMALALAHPPQGGLGIAADRRFDQLVQGIQNPRLCLGRRLAAAARSANPRAEHHRARTQVCQAAINRAARNPGRPRYRDHAAMSGRARLTGREQPPPSLVQDRLKRLEASLDGSDVDHSVRIDAPAGKSRPISGFVRCVLTVHSILFFRFGCPGSGPKFRRILQHRLQVLLPFASCLCE